MRAEVYGSAASQSPTDKFIVVGGVPDSSYIVASLFHDTDVHLGSVG
jgi:hypothetical protein